MSGASATRLTQPMRHPDTSARPLMSRRGWWLVVIGFLIPGSAQVVAGNRKLGRFGLAATLTMWALALVALGFAIFWRFGLLWAFSNPWVLTILQALVALYAVLWVILGINTLMLVRLVRTGERARFGIAALAVVLMVFSAGTAAYAANVIGATRGAFSDLFVAKAPPQPPSDGYYNILLLGADSGDGRDSMRFDSISVVSINAETGKTTITGIPRDMPNVPFSDGPMKDLYPDGHTAHPDDECGWGSGINQLNTEVQICRADQKLYPNAKEHNSTAGVEATRDAAQGVLGIKIQYYAFIDMNHFAQLIDALGGVDINVDERLPKGGGPSYEGEPAEDWAQGWIEPGQQHMDGDTAQWFARSRYTTSDWDRMRRQRILQEAIFKQFTPQNIASHFESVAKAGVTMVETDIPSSMLPTFIELGTKARQQGMDKIELTPEGENIDPDNPDFAHIRDLVHERLHPAKEKDK